MRRTYWRTFSGLVYHCFVIGRSPLRDARGRPYRYRSLCNRAGRHDLKPGGQFQNRPEAVLRCADCDRREMKLAGASESLPACRNTIERIDPVTMQPRRKV